MFHERLAWSNRLSIRVSTVVDHQVKRWSRGQGAVVCGGLLPRDLLEQQHPPFRLEGLPRQECKRRLPCAFAAFVTTMIMVKHDQIEGLLGDLPFATLERGANERMHHLDQRGGPYKGVKLVEHQDVERVKVIAKEPCGARQPAFSFAVMVTLGLGWCLARAMIMVPRQHENIHDIVRHHGTEFRINRFGLCKRDDHVIDRRVNGFERVGKGGAVEIFAPVEKPRQFCAHAFDGAQSPMRRASLERCTKSLEQHGEVVVECDGWRTGVMRLCIWVETLFQSGRAVGTGKLLRRIVFLAHGRRGVACQLMQHLEEVSKRVAIIRHPQRPVARGLRAGHEAQATIRSQLNVEDRRASRVHGDQNRRVEGKNLVAQIKHPFLRWH